MSTQPPEREDGSPANMDDDRLDPSPDGDAASSDEETIKGDLDHGNIAIVLNEDIHDDASNAPAEQAPIANHYRQLLHDQEDGSDGGSSMDGLPRRAGSPIDSLLSIPDGSPSVQVRAQGSRSEDFLICL
ncbi:hypothetical protein F5Y19DRAFT_348420 [Xylariaceae sp. FL1651]|nr:hypothetical protein F5Y19DRAFT_348420 [Xylariaceae sp. FL1651]